MQRDFQHNRKKAYSGRRSAMDLGMGIIYAGMGAFFVLSEPLGFRMEFLQKPFSYILGGICLLYGGFRIFRGIRKNYYREED